MAVVKFNDSTVTSQRHLLRKSAKTPFGKLTNNINKSYKTCNNQ